MKYHYLKHLFIVFLLLCATIAEAHDFVTNGIYYELTADGVVVTYAGNSYSEVANEYSGEVVIPATVSYYGKEYDVKYISSNAFRDCTNLTSIVIGDNITNIYSYAFSGCNNLTRVSIGKSLYSISDAFRYCNSITSVHYNCSYVVKCEINNASVKEITFGDNVKSVSTFSSTGWYKEQPDGLLYLDNWFIGYKGNEPIGNVVIAEGTTHIDGSALYNNKLITSVFIPKSVKYIGEHFLRLCTGLTALNVDIDNPIYDSRENCNAIIETNSNTIIKACVNTVIPTTVEIIGAVSFEYLDLVEIEIPNNIVEIAASAFNSCENLKSVVIGNGVTLIEDYAFANCSVLENLKLGDSVTIIGTGAFQYCSSLADIKLPNSVLRIKENVFYGTKWYNGQTEYPYILDGWILYDNNRSPITTGIRGIADRVYTYRDLYGIDLKFSNTTVAVGEFAFSSSGVHSVLLPNSIVYMGAGAFYNTCLTEVVIPNSITNILSATFQSCRYLVRVVIPSSVINIESSAFYLSSNIKELYVLAKEAPLVDEKGVVVFDNTKATLYVPIGSKESYQSSPVWKNFENIVEIQTEYNISYVVDGNVIASETLTVGEIITPPVNIPQKEEYNFSWSNYPSTMPAKDIVFEGTYSAKSYRVTYVIDGEVYKTVYIDYGEELVLPDSPVKEGYVFSGWSESPKTMPAEDIIINGSFAIIANINYVESEQEKQDVYNLKGERIVNYNKLENGVYIKNGKKILVW